MVVRAQDGGDATLYNDLFILVTLIHVNHPPSIQSGLTFNVSEGPGGVRLLDLSSVVSDPDTNDNPISSLQITITSGDPNGRHHFYHKHTTTEANEYNY